MTANKYAGTQTEKNLQEAFAGESQARNCQVYVRTVAANNAQPLTQDQCLRALHHLRVQSTSKTAPQAK